MNHVFNTLHNLNVLYWNRNNQNFIYVSKFLFVQSFFRPNIFSISVKSQQWVDMMLQPNANFYEIRDAFETEWGSDEYVRGKGFKQFKRWANFWETRVLEDGSFPVNSRDWGNFKNLIVGNQTKSGGVGRLATNGPIFSCQYRFLECWIG